MNKYIPLHVHSDASLGDGISKPSQIANRCQKIGADACALTDHGNIANSIKFLKEMRKLNKKPILGCEFYVCDQPPNIKDETNRKLHHLLILAKNKNGWKSLIKMVSEANKPENFYYKPRLDIPTILELSNDVIIIDGHLGSVLSSRLFVDTNFKCSNEQEAKKQIRRDWRESIFGYINIMQERFGDDYYLECQLIDKKNLPQTAVLTNAMRYISPKTKCKTVATCDAHYTDKEDAIIQRIVLCSAHNQTLDSVYGNPEKSLVFYYSNNYHIPSYNEMVLCGHTSEELSTTLEIADKCEIYELKSLPILPKLPEVENPQQALLQACRDGWKKRLNEINTNAKDKGISIDIYVNRVKYELSIIEKFELADYFLVVADIVKYYRNSGHITSPGRGSSAGSIVLWLLGVTQIDPIKYDLLFERFFNPARYTPDHVSFNEYTFEQFVGVYLPSTTYSVTQ